MVILKKFHAKLSVTQMPRLVFKEQKQSLKYTFLNLCVLVPRYEIYKILKCDIIENRKYPIIPHLIGEK